MSTRLPTGEQVCVLKPTSPTRPINTNPRYGSARLPKDTSFFTTPAGLSLTLIIITFTIITIYSLYRILTA